MHQMIGLLAALAMSGLALAAAPGAQPGLPKESPGLPKESPGLPKESPGLPKESPDLTVERLAIPGPSGAAHRLIAYLARPSGEGPHPGVVLVHDRSGNDAHNQDVTRRLASEGFAVLLVDLYSRAGGTEKLAAGEKPVWEAAPIAAEDALADLGAGLDWLKRQCFVAPERVGLLGFCMGGRFALLFAEARLDLRATVVYYGILVAQGDVDPIAHADRIPGAFLGHFGETDRIIPLESVHRLEARLKEAKVPATVYTYLGAGHAFNNDRSPAAYNAEAAALAWKRTVEFLKRELKPK